MTHTNHRQGTVESLSKDYVIFVYAARGINNNGAGPKCQAFLHMAFQHEPVNAGSPQVGNLFTTSANELIEGTGGQTKAYAIFDTKKKAEALVRDITAADLGLSVIVSGLFNEVDSICRTAGIKRHTSQCSLGVWGKTEKLPGEQVMDIITMCGHGMVSSNLVRKLAVDVKKYRLSLQDAAGQLAKPCVCGVFNPRRAEDILREYIDGSLSGNNIYF
ncbi:hypothetical protein ACFLWS_08865 [Chloroflexota bacterium]